MKLGIKLVVTILAISLLVMVIPDCGPGTAGKSERETSEISGQDTFQGASTMPKYIIRTITLAHCARGPKICAKCRDMAVPKICLLDIDLPNQGQVSRRTIEVLVGGQKAWREFDVVKTFADEPEARAYAAEHGITDMELDQSGKPENTEGMDQLRRFLISLDSLVISLCTEQQTKLPDRTSPLFDAGEHFFMKLSTSGGAGVHPVLRNGLP